MIFCQGQKVSSASVISMLVDDTCLEQGSVSMCTPGLQARIQQHFHYSAHLCPQDLLPVDVGNWGVHVIIPKWAFTNVNETTMRYVPVTISGTSILLNETMPMDQVATAG